MQTAFILLDYYSKITHYCWFFLIRGGTIEGKVVDLTTRRSPIPSSGLEIKLDLTFSGSTGDGPVRVGVQWLVGRGAAGPGRLSG